MFTLVRCRAPVRVGLVRFIWPLQALSGSCIPARSFTVVMILAQMLSEECNFQVEVQQEVLSAVVLHPSIAVGYPKAGRRSNNTDFVLICSLVRMRH